MRKDNVTAVNKPETFIDDPLTEILRQGAKRLLAAALEAEIDIFFESAQGFKR